MRRTSVGLVQLPRRAASAASRRYSVRAMRVLMVAWEYPPLAVGGDAAHVDGLARALGAGRPRRRGAHRRASPGLHRTSTRPRRARAAGQHRPAVDARRLRRRRVRRRPTTTSCSCRARSATGARRRPRPRLARRLGGRHAGGAPGVPLVATFHPRARPATAGACRRGRRRDQRRRVVAGAPRQPGDRLLAVHGPRGARRRSSCPPSKVHRVPNGVDPTWWATGEHRGAARAAGARVGPRPVREGVPGAGPGDEPAAVAGARASRCVIAGRGSYLPELQSQIDVEGVSDIVASPGSCPTTKLRDSLHRAGCVVIPSLYEPFGIVALEALAGGAPLIVARTGGLAEIVEGTGAGLLFEPGQRRRAGGAASRRC